MKHIFTPEGVCSRAIEIEIEDGLIESVKFKGGCNGNLQGIGALVKGMRPSDVVSRLGGICCGSKGTSCPDQLARALSTLAEE